MSTSVSIHVHGRIDAVTLNVPANGGSCVHLITEGCDIFMNGWAAEAAREARVLAAQLIKAAQKIEGEIGEDAIRQDAESYAAAEARLSLEAKRAAVSTMRWTSNGVTLRLPRSSRRR